MAGFFEGLLTSIFGGLGSMFISSNNQNERDSLLAEQDRIFNQRLEQSGIQRDRAVSGLQQLIDSQRGRNPADVINNFVSSYQESPYNQYLKEQAIASTENIVKDQNLLGSQLGRQSIQNTAAIAANSGLNSYLNAGIGLQNQFDSTNASLEATKAGIIGNFANSMTNSANQAYNTNVSGINNTYNQTISKPNIFDKIASTGVEETLNSLLSKNSSETSRNQSIGVR